MWFVVVYCIWQYRNLCVFEGKEFGKETLKQKYLFMAWSWLKTKQKSFDYSYLLWSLNLGRC